MSRTFPVIFALGPLHLPAHFVFEALAYAVGIRLYLRARSSAVSEDTLFSVLVGAALGAALGSKLLYWLEWPLDTWQHRLDPAWLMGGKSVVGGLLGGWCGVELAKRRAGETQSTGDRFVVPLGIAMIIGRVGCFLAGLDDHTFGIATTSPLGVDFGDGVTRHPTQLYEIAALTLLLALTRVPFPLPGQRFRAFMAGYLAFRFFCDFLKPDPRWLLGMSAIQVASLLGFAYCAVQFTSGFKLARERHV